MTIPFPPAQGSESPPVSGPQQSSHAAEACLASEQLHSPQALALLRISLNLGPCPSKRDPSEWPSGGLHRQSAMEVVAVVPRKGRRCTASAHSPDVLPGFSGNWQETLKRTLVWGRDVIALNRTPAVPPKMKREPSIAEADVARL